MSKNLKSGWGGQRHRPIPAWQRIAELRSRRVPVPLTQTEYRSLNMYAARHGMDMSRVFLSLLEKSIQEIQAGGDPLGKTSGRSREPAA